MAEAIKELSESQTYNVLQKAIRSKVSRSKSPIWHIFGYGFIRKVKKMNLESWTVENIDFWTDIEKVDAITSQLDETKVGFKKRISPK